MTSSQVGGARAARPSGVKGMTFGFTRLGLGLLAVMAFLGQAQAQSSRVRGTVETVTADSLTVRDAQGTAIQMELAPNWRVSVVAPIGVDAIQPGSFIGTTNVVQPDGSGRSVEVHVFPPSMKPGEGDRVMDGATGTKMTNGTVGQVVRVADGSELDVTYPGGQRHIVVPPDVPIMSMMPGERDLVQPGTPVVVVTVAGTDGARVARFVMVGINGATPPT